MFKTYEEVSVDGLFVCKIAVNIFDIVEIECMQSGLSKIYLKASNSNYSRFIIVRDKIEDIVADINENW